MTDSCVTFWPKTVHRLHVDQNCNIIYAAVTVLWNIIIRFPYQKDFWQNRSGSRTRCFLHFVKEISAFQSKLPFRLQMISVWINQTFLRLITLSQTTHFRRFRIERVCRRQFDKNGRKVSKWVENTVGKGEIARYEQFLLFPQCIQKTCTADT